MIHGDNMNITPGNVYQLTVLRKTDIGYILKDENEEFFLHNNESFNKELGVNEIVDAFLYYDNQGRIAATLATPKLMLGLPERLSVVSINWSLGVFMDMGISKDILFSKDDLPLNQDEWPKIGDVIYVKMIHKKRLTAKPVNKIDVNHDMDLPMKTEVSAVIHNIGHAGLNLLTDDDVWVFVHRSMFKEDVWIGKRVNVVITNKSEKGYSGSMIKQKESQMVDDADIVLQYLIKHETLDLDANSSPEDIRRMFDMSKKAFKRSIGILYKQRRVVFEDGKTILIVPSDKKN
jgi:predicted RNA-binding protein (virulence factor B family)